MNILLTGASGFIGRALYPALTARGHDLACVFRHRHRGWAKQAFPDCRRYFVHQMDDSTDWQPCLEGMDGVVHLAALAHMVSRSERERRRHQVLEVNYKAACHLAAQAALQGVKRFLFMSSIGVNGKSSGSDPFRETDRENPHNIYAESKFMAEEAIKETAAGSGMEVVILRPPLVYGPGVKANFFKLLKLVYSGIPLPFQGVSNQRSFICLENLVDAVCLCMAHERAGNQTFVVRDGRDLSTRLLVEKIAAAMGRRPRLFPMPEKVMKALLFAAGRESIHERLWGTLQVDDTRIRTILGWHPPVTSDRGIRETVRWYLDVRGSQTRPPGKGRS
jgi:nucleoside-diphosphate-sugar epimerase